MITLLSSLTRHNWEWLSGAQTIPVTGSLCKFNSSIETLAFALLSKIYIIFLSKLKAAIKLGVCKFHANLLIGVLPFVSYIMVE